MKKTFLFLIGIYTILGLNAQVVSEYDINDFTTADLDGQDDWATFLYTTGPVDLSAGSVASPAFENLLATDPAMRNCVNKNLLAFSVPYEPFKEMTNNIETSFLNTYIWNK